MTPSMVPTEPMTLIDGRLVESNENRVLGANVHFGHSLPRRDQSQQPRLAKSSAIDSCAQQWQEDHPPSLELSPSPAQTPRSSSCEGKSS